MTKHPIVFFKYLINRLFQPFIKTPKKEIYFSSIERYSKDLKVLKEQQKESQA
jgi:hypothetical protein